MPREAPPHVCQKDHNEIVGGTTALDELCTLPPSQRSPWRHICAACAFEKGFLAGLRYARNEFSLASIKVDNTEAELERSRRLEVAHPKHGVCG